MKRLTLLCISPLVLANIAFAGGQNEPAYKHEARPHHHHHQNHFTGFSVTGAIGGIVGELDANQNFFGESFAGDNAEGEVEYGFSSDNAVADSDNLELFEANVAGLIGIEYAYQFNNGFLLGVAATAGFNNVDFNNTLNVNDQSFVNDDGDTFFNFSTASTTLEAELENDFALLFKAGFVVRQNTLFYALVGPRWGNFETTLSSSYNNNGGAFCAGPFDCDNGWDSTLTDSESNSEYQLGVTAGLGVRQVVSDHFMIGLEYAYTHYGDLDSLDNENGNLFEDSCNSANGGTCTDLSMDFNANALDLISNTHTVMATLSYKF